ncbi:MAG: fibronectin type III domain-containing protein, partial [Planctomycetota bacterium]
MPKRLVLGFLLISLLALGYGGLCNVSKNETTIAGSSAPLPSAVSGLVVTVASATQINLTWEDNSNSEDGVKIERASASGGQAGTYAQIATTVADITSYQDTGVADGDTYYYRVRAFNDNGNSMYSNEASATIPLSAPSALNTTTVGATQITVSWTDNSLSEDGYKIERDPGNGYSALATVGANINTYSDTGLAEGMVYSYRVKAYKSAEETAYTNVISA